MRAVPRQYAYRFGVNAIALSYFNVGSSRRIPYEHDFSRGVEVWAMHDGSILLRKPGKGRRDPDVRLWDHFDVSESE